MSSSPLLDPTSRLALSITTLKRWIILCILFPIWMSIFSICQPSAKTWSNSAALERCSITMSSTIWLRWLPNIPRWLRRSCTRLASNSSLMDTTAQLRPLGFSFTIWPSTPTPRRNFRQISTICSRPRLQEKGSVRRTSTRWNTLTRLNTMSFNISFYLLWRWYAKVRDSAVSPSLRGFVLETGKFQEKTSSYLKTLKSTFLSWVKLCWTRPGVTSSQTPGWASLRPKIFSRPRKVRSGQVREQGIYWQQQFPNFRRWTKVRRPHLDSCLAG